MERKTKEITLNQDVGSAKKGTVFIQGLHGIPDSTDYWKGHSASSFYWEKGTKKEDNAFLKENWLIGDDFDYTK